MYESYENARKMAQTLFGSINAEKVQKALRPKPECIPKLAAADPMNTLEKAKQRLVAAGLNADGVGTLLDESTREDFGLYAESVENLSGTIRIPLGVAGPLQVNGIHAQGLYWIPLATHEATLVASYHRGILALNGSGGCSVLFLNEAMGRAPVFTFANLGEVAAFMSWALMQRETFNELVASTTEHGTLDDIRFTVEGNNVYVLFEMLTQDAAGQNMVTKAAESVCKYIAKHSPVKPVGWIVESNLSGDKKASNRSFLGVRGRKVTAEAEISSEMLKRVLRTDSEALVTSWRTMMLGGTMSGAIGAQGHYANGLAALYLATGQDVACVAESAVGVTRLEQRENGNMYCSATLPNLVVGTVGGGTGLPTQQACLELMGLAGTGHARALAEVCAGVALAGELSIIAAIASGEFARSHELLGRLRKRKSRAKKN